MDKSKKLLIVLKIVFKERKVEDSVSLELLRQIAFNERGFNESLKYAESLIKLSKKLNSNIYLYRGYLQKRSGT